MALATTPRSAVQASLGDAVPDVLVVETAVGPATGAFVGALLGAPVTGEPVATEMLGCDGLCVCTTVGPFVGARIGVVEGATTGDADGPLVGR